MRFGILSDIHSNREALDAVLRAFDDLRIDEYICLGDVVGYGADPAYCVKKIRDLCSVCILGNHDAAVAERMDYTYYYDAARNALDWTRSVLDADQLAWLKELPYADNRPSNGVCFTHGEPVQPEAYNYVYTVEQARYLLPHYEELLPLTFVGHSHLRRIYRLAPPDKVLDLSVDETELDDLDRAKYLVAVGSVGQPRDYDPRASFCTYDTDDRVVTLYRVEYDVEAAARKIIEQGLPQSFAYRLFNGI